MTGVLITLMTHWLTKKIFFLQSSTFFSSSDCFQDVQTEDSHKYVDDLDVRGVPKKTRPLTQLTFFRQHTLLFF